MADVEDLDSTNPSGFPQSPSAFDADPRVSFSKLDDKFILETDESTEYEWDTALKRWIPVLDQELLDQQAAIYRVEGAEEYNTVPQKRSEKRTMMRYETEEDQEIAVDKEQTSHKPKKARVNTACYITSIPLDADKDEIKNVFSKCGVIAEEIDSGEPRIKMYEDDKGQFKGDALVVYFRPESVELAVQMLDDSDFRLGTEGPMGKMRVQAADFSYKTQQAAPEKKSKKDQSKIIKRTQKLNNKLADWDDDDPQVLQEVSSQFDKVVILKHMFSLQELEDDPAAILEIKEDIREECSKLGEVTNVVLFDKEPNGVASVRFANAEAARACVSLMDGRWFDERRLEAYIPQGDEKFKKSNEKQQGLFDDDEEGEGARLDKFGEWLEEN